MAKKSSKKESPQDPPAPANDASKDEQIGFHKGSLMTLSKEREELARIIGIVEQLMQMHVAALNELGIKLDGMQGAPQPTSAESPQPRKKPPIEDLL